MKRRVLPALAIGGVLALVVSACGSDDDDPAAAGSDATSDTAAPASGEPLKIMVIGSIEGLGLDFHQQVVGAEAGADGINERGGVNGRPIEVSSCNDQFLNDETAACARKAVSEGVVAVVGGFSASGDTSYVDILADAGIPVVGAWALGIVPTEDPLLTNDNSWPVAGGTALSAIGAGALAADQGADLVNIVARDGNTGLADLVQQGLDTADGSAKVGKFVEMPLGTADVSPFVASAVQGDPDMIVILHAAGETAKTIAGLRQAGSDAKIIVSSTSLTETNLDSLGDAAEGVYFTAQFLLPAAGGDLVEQYVDEVDAVDADAPKDDFGQNAYAAVTAFASVAASLEDVTGAALVDALNRADSVDLGIGPKIDFTDPQGGIPRMFNPNVLFGVVDSGDLTLLSDDFVNVLA
jgi:branched-chain amino acid transport system substrate-binding protein